MKNMQFTRKKCGEHELSREAGFRKWLLVPLLVHIKQYILYFPNVFRFYQPKNRWTRHTNKLIKRQVSEIRESLLWFRKFKKKTNKKKTKKTSTTPSCSGPISAQNIRGHSLQRAVFSHTMPKIDFWYFPRFSWGENINRIITSPLGPWSHFKVSGMFPSTTNRLQE